MKPKTMRRAYLREAAVTLIFAQCAVWFVSPARIVAWANRPPRHIRRFAGNEAGWVSWAIENLCTRSGISALCLPRALATHAMLRRRGIASRLCLGVARDAGGLTAHAWVEIGNNKVGGDTEEDRFTRVAEYG